MRRQSCLEKAFGSWGMASDYLAPGRSRLAPVGDAATYFGASEATIFSKR